jgi:hypothetical protein
VVDQLQHGSSRQALPTRVVRVDQNQSVSPVRELTQVFRVMR